MLPRAVDRLIEQFQRIPGVGPKTAFRYAMFVVAGGGDVANGLGRELLAVADSITRCSQCLHLANHPEPGEPAICEICSDSRRSPKQLCVIASVQDLLAIENSGAFTGRYLVLPRLLSPLDGVGPDDLPLELLRERVRSDGVNEVILATPPSIDGEATALLLARELEALQVTVSRIASGIPHGGDLEYTDRITLGRALSGRLPMAAGPKSD